MAEPALVEVSLVALVRRVGNFAQILTTRRSSGAHLAGFRELPGGKCEPGEMPAAAAARELREETGIRVRECDLTPLVQTMHCYPERNVRLIAFAALVPQASDVEPAGQCGCEWICVRDLPQAGFPSANGPITAELTRRFG